MSSNVLPVPAVVVGAGLNGLGVARSLHAAGVTTWLADTDIARPEMRSHCARPLRVTALRGEGLVQTLLEHARSTFFGQRPVLLMTQEQAVRAVVAAREALLPWYRFLWPEASVVNAVMHKNGFDELAKLMGLRVPTTLHVRSAMDLESALDLPMPVVIKPGRHEPEFERLFRKAYQVTDRTHARDLLVRMHNVLPDLIVQEWIPGDDTHLFFCLQVLSETGHVQASFLGRKIRSWPPLTGGTASCMQAEDNAGLSERTGSFFSRVGVFGLASMEYKLHAETGEFVAIEATVGRTDYQEEVATLNGTNLPYAYYCAALGLASPLFDSSTSKRHVIWRDRDSDRRSSVSPKQTVSGWPVPGHVRDAIWRFSDPAPWFALQVHRVKSRLRRLTGIRASSSGACQ